MHLFKWVSFCGKGCQKRWIVSEDDLGLMYKEVGDERDSVMV